MLPDPVTSFISVSELVSQQHLPCVSNLSWSTNQQRAWAKEAELALPGHQALQRVNLLLTARLEEGRLGGWRLRDASGSVPCEVGAASAAWAAAVALTASLCPLQCVSSSPLWLHRLVFLPHWNYIPAAPGQDGGHVELVTPPVLLCPAPDRRTEFVRAAGLREAAGCLSNRYVSPGPKRRRRRRLYSFHTGKACFYRLVLNTTFTHTEDMQSGWVRTLSGQEHA